jgi:tetratricopeptide (TPR) repeat protein
MISRPMASSPRLAVLGVLLLVVTFAAYGRAFDHSFVEWDDPAYVVDNPLVQAHDFGALWTSVVAGNYHPLTMLSLALNARGRPPSPWPFLVTNVALHLLDTLLVFWLAWILSRGKPWVAFLTALWFGIHPMHVESVAWISERKDVLYALFFLGATVAYLRFLEAPEARGRWLALCFGLFVLSCLSKAMAVTFPLVMGLLDFWKDRRIGLTRSVLEKLPFVIVAIVFGLLAVHLQAGGDLQGRLHPIDPGRRALSLGLPYSPYQRVALPSYGHAAYLLRFFAPTHLSAFEPYPSAAEASGLRYTLAPFVLILTVALAWWAGRRWPPLGFGLGWYFATIVLVLQWLPVGGALTANRYTYLAYIGLAFPLAMGAQELRERRPRLGAAVLGACGVFSVFLFVQAVRQVDTWKNDEALWTQVIHEYPHTAFPYANRGIERREAGRLQEAVGDLRTALLLGYAKSDVYDNLGLAYAGLGERDSAALMFRRAMQHSDPTGLSSSRRGEALENIGIAYGSIGMLDSALVFFDRALQIVPNNSDWQYNRALTQLKLRRPREAIRDLDGALASSPRDPATLHEARGYAWMQLGLDREAESEFGRSLALDSKRPEALYQRGLCRKRMGEIPGAVEDFQAVLRLDPGHANARAELQALTTDRTARTKSVARAR